MTTFHEIEREQFEQELTQITASIDDPKERTRALLAKLTEMANTFEPNGLVASIEVIDHARPAPPGTHHAGMMLMVACDTDALVQHTAQCLLVLLNGGTPMSAITDKLAEFRLRGLGA